MTENVKLVFEVEDLNNASPATVSRCGQVYISLSDLGSEMVIDGYVKYRKTTFNRADEADKLDKMIKKWILTKNVFDVWGKLTKNGEVMPVNET